MPKFNGHKYTWEAPFRSVRHMWQLRGPDGGIHFTASISANKEWPTTCGLEFHHARSSGYYRCTSEAPDHLNCVVIGEPCWHDGTSLYASETLWPMIEPILRNGDHDAIFRILEKEYVERIEYIRKVDES